MRQAALFWAQARQRGQPTAGDNSIDADVILAAQAATLSRRPYSLPRMSDTWRASFRLRYGTNSCSPRTRSLTAYARSIFFAPGETGADPGGAGGRASSGVGHAFGQPFAISARTGSSRSTSSARA